MARKRSLSGLERFCLSGVYVVGSRSDVLGREIGGCEAGLNVHIFVGGLDVIYLYGGFWGFLGFKCLYGRFRCLYICMGGLGIYVGV